MERRFGQYILLERIGTGGMAEVFRARKEGSRLFARDESGRRFSREIALKLILPHLSREDSFRELFSREAHLASLLDHPNIVAIQDYGTLDGTDYIVMDYVRGMDLREMLRRLPGGRRIPLEESVSILYRISRGLACAHDRKTSDSPEGIIHRDLSPHNILVSTEGEIKIADFGIARAVRTDATKTTGFRGKLSYMSPEQAEGRPLDNRSDLFSLGTISHQLLTGEHPFTRGSDPATLRAIQQGDYRPIPDSLQIPGPLRSLVESTLHVNPDSRPPSAHDVAEGFEPFLKPLSEINLGRRVFHLRKEASGGVRDVSATAVTLQMPARRRIPMAVLVGLALVISTWLIANPGGTRKDPLREFAGARTLESTTGEVADNPVIEAAPVVIRTSPSGATITVDGKEIGRSPVSVTPVADGKAMKIEANLYGFEPAIIELGSDISSLEDTVTLTPLPTSDVRVGAKPWAGVYYRGELVDYTPTVVPGVPVGERTFTLVNDALGVTRVVTLNVRSGGENVVSEDLNTRIR